MKCQSCGAEIGTAKVCEFCGSKITYKMQKEMEQVNKQGCPKCGSTNIQFNRENQGEYRGKNSKRIVHKTIGFCKDCGFTWDPNIGNRSSKRIDDKMVMWILGWIFFFPIPVMILVWRKKNTWDKKIKIAVTVVFWLILLIGVVNSGSGNETELESTAVVEESASTENTVKEIQAKSTEVLENVRETSHIYDNAEIVDLMSGDGSKKIGTISVIKAEKSECTDEALLDWYFNYVKEHDDCTYNLIVYTDVHGRGVSSLGKERIQKDYKIIEDGHGSYTLGDSSGATYYDVDEEEKKLVLNSTMVDDDVINEARSKIDAIIQDEYKEGEQYSVDIAGEEGNLDCYITLVSSSFEGADYQSIAVDIASKVKSLDLGIGNFSIGFQVDNNSFNALSNIENLSEQDASEITTKIQD